MGMDQLLSPIAEVAEFAESSPGLELCHQPRHDGLHAFNHVLAAKARLDTRDPLGQQRAKCGASLSQIRRGLFKGFQDLKGFSCAMGEQHVEHLAWNTRVRGDAVSKRTARAESNSAPPKNQQGNDEHHSKNGS